MQCQLLGAGELRLEDTWTGQAWSMGVSLWPSSPLEDRPQAKISPRRVISRLWLLPADTTAARPFLLLCKTCKVSVRADVMRASAVCLCMPLLSMLLYTHPGSCNSLLATKKSKACRSQ